MHHCCWKKCSCLQAVRGKYAYSCTSEPSAPVVVCPVAVTVLVHDANMHHDKLLVTPHELYPIHFPCSHSTFCTVIQTACLPAKGVADICTHVEQASLQIVPSKPIVCTSIHPIECNRCARQNPTCRLESLLCMMVEGSCRPQILAGHSDENQTTPRKPPL